MERCAGAAGDPRLDEFEALWLVTGLYDPWALTVGDGASAGFQVGPYLPRTIHGNASRSV